jgi:DNA-binding beta-propeller fold protein YncE
MEGCGITAGDSFLAQELGEIMASPAWRTQRSLAIITFDEDDTDYQHPAQRVPTIILGSAGVRRGYVSATRYTHYSLLPAPAMTSVVPGAGFQPAVATRQATTRQPVAWIANYASATVTPLNLVTRKAGRPVPVGSDPVAVAVTPDGRTV